MDEALEIIRDYMEITKRTRTKYHVSECKEVVSKLQAHKANIKELKELKEWYKDRRDFFMSQKEYVRAQEAEKILQKLEELDK